MSISHLSAIWLVMSILLISAIPLAQGAQEDWILSGPEHTREGYFQLRLEGPDGSSADHVSFTIEQSRDEQFEEVTARFSPLGSFRQISLSGFDDGRYYFRAHIELNGDSHYSNTHALDVRHYPVWQALTLFCLGALVFTALLLTMWRLHRSFARKDTASQSDTSQSAKPDAGTR